MPGQGTRARGQCGWRGRVERGGEGREMEGKVGARSLRGLE